MWHLNGGNDRNGTVTDHQSQGVSRLKIQIREVAEEVRRCYRTYDDDESLDDSPMLARDNLNYPYPELVI